MVDRISKITLNLVQFFTTDKMLSLRESYAKIMHNLLINYE